MGEATSPSLELSSDLSSDMSASESPHTAMRMQRSVSADSALPASPQSNPVTACNLTSPNSLYPLARRPSCLSRTLSTRSTSSTSSNLSNRSVRFCEKVPKVKYTYPKGVYDRAPIVVDENLALKRCRELQDEGENSGPAKWVVDCFYASHGVAVPSEPEEVRVEDDSAPNESLEMLSPSILVLDNAIEVAGSLDSAASGESLPSLSSDCSVASSETSEFSDGEAGADDDDHTSNGTYSPMPSRMVSQSANFEAKHRFFNSPRSVSSPTSYSNKQAPTSPAQPNFMRWDLPISEPLCCANPGSERQASDKDGTTHDAEREKRKLLRLKMQDMARKQANPWDDCLGGF